MTDPEGFPGDLPGLRQQCRSRFGVTTVGTYGSTELSR
jgi:hypothetical protein